MDNTAFSGKNVSILVGTETTYASAGTADKDLGYIQDAPVTEAEDKERVGSVGARNAQHNIRTRYRITGSLDVIYQHARILEYVLGSVTHTGGSDPYTHTFSEADALPSLKMHATKSYTSTGRKRIIQGIKTDSWTLRAEKGSTLKWNSDWIGKTCTISTATASQTIDDIVPAIPPQFILYTGATAAEPTVALDYVQSFELTISNNLEVKESFSSVEIEEPISQERNYTGKITFAADDAAEIDKQISLMLGTTTSTTPADTQTERAIRFLWTNGLTLEDSLDLYINGCTFDSLSDPYPKNGIIYYDMSFTGKSLGACVSKDDISSVLW